MLGGMPPSLPVRLAEAAIARLDGSYLRGDSGTQTVHGTTSGMSGAAILNALSGIGSGLDSGSTARPNTLREYLTPEELVALMRGSVYRRIIELLPRWATVRGFTLTDSTDEQRPLAAAMRRLKVRDVFRRADTWGRALGEARVLLVTSDMGRLDQPLVPAKVKRVVRLEVLDRLEFTAEVFEGDVSRGPLGDPVLYQVHPMRSSVGFGGRVHASRLLRFYGDPVPPSQTGFGVWGWGADAVGQALWDGIRNLSQTGAAGARAAQELSVSVFKLANGAQQRSGDDRTSALGMMALLNRMKSIANMVLLTPNDDYQRVNVNATGYADLSQGARMELALLTGYPLALLFGEAPSGLSTDASSWITNWHANVAAWREERYRDPLETLAELLYVSEQGGTPDEWAVEFPALGDLTEKERAEIRLITTQADSAAIMDGVLTPDEVRARYSTPGGYVYDLQPVVEVEPQAPAAIDPSVEAEARRLVEGARTASSAAPARGGEVTPTATATTALLPEDVKPLNGAQITAAQTILGSIVAGELTTEAGRLLLEGIVPPQRARDLVSAMAGAVPAVAGAAPATDRFDAVEGAVWIGAVLPDAARAAWDAARVAVEGVTGMLDSPGDDPHVTVLYMGQVDAAALPEVLEIARQVAERVQPTEAATEHAHAFAPGPSSDGRWPVVLDVCRAWGLWEVQQQLLPRLAHLITARQFPTYRAHVTLGYAADLSPEQQAALAELELPESEWMIGGIQVRYGARVLATLPFAGRMDQAAAQ
jgi:uncharacterized protein